MQPDRSVLRTYFAKLGLAHEIADLYLALYTKGPQTISSLSRTAHVERTRIYRLIDMLLESSLVEVETHDKRTVIKAAPISQLHVLINKREEELKNLTDELALLEQVMARNTLSNEAFHVRLYDGSAAILRLLEEVAKSSSDASSPDPFFLYSSNHLAASVGERPIGRMLTEFRTAGIPIHIYEMEDAVTPWVVCGDTVVYVQQTEGTVSALALRNVAIADSHRQLFALMTRS